MAAWGYEFYHLVLKKIKFVSPRGHVISSIYPLVKNDDNFSLLFEIANQLFTRHLLYLAP